MCACFDVCVYCARARMELYVDNWQHALEQFFAACPGFEEAEVVLDRKASFGDKLVFDVHHYEGGISSALTQALEARFAGLVKLSWLPHPASARLSLLTVTVTRPNSRVLAALGGIWRAQERLLDSFTLPWWSLLLLGALCASLAAHAAYLLDEHTSAHTGAFSNLQHMFVHTLARLHVWSASITTQ